jgi:hypothetical protein
MALPQNFPTLEVSMAAASAFFLQVLVKSGCIAITAPADFFMDWLNDEQLKN